MAPILDAFPFPWSNPEAQQLHQTLAQLYPTPPAALNVAMRADLDTSQVNSQQAPFHVWADILTLGANAGENRRLVRTVLDLLGPNSPRRPFLEALLADRPSRVDPEPRTGDGAPIFLKGDDEVTEPEALLYQDDLTLQIGRVPSLIATLQKLLALAPAVCHLAVDVQGERMQGTAFRVGPDLLLTNWHVLHRNDGEKATAVTAKFGYEDDGQGHELAPRNIRCDVASIVTEKADDWAVIRAAEPLDDAWPVVKLSEAAAPTKGGAAFIVQHPGGQSKRLGFVRNQVTSFNDRVAHYLTDTREGSSGAPVFDALGRLIALHRAGGRPQDIVGRAPLKKNEGVRIERIAEGLKRLGVKFP